MSVTQGTNAATGTANTETQVNRKALDAKLVGSFKSAQLTLEKVSALILECQESEVWKDEKVTNADGKPFRSWGAYLADRLSTYPLVNKALSKPMVAALLEAGVSVRAAAKAADVSKSTASNVNQERKGKRPARPNDGTAKPAKGKQDTDGVGSTPAQEATKAVTQAVNALKRVNDSVADMSVTELDLLAEKLAETAGIVSGMRALQEQNAQTETAKAAA